MCRARRLALVMQFLLGLLPVLLALAWLAAFFDVDIVGTPGDVVVRGCRGSRGHGRSGLRNGSLLRARGCVR
jgi:hypothetical protein